MPELTQDEADYLIKLEKCRSDNATYLCPTIGKRIHIPIESLDHEYQFLLDFTRSYTNAISFSLQDRFRGNVILVRLDTYKEHRNPDDTIIPGPHIHYYSEQYGDAFAEPLPAGTIFDPEDLMGVADMFMRLCNITNPPLLALAGGLI